MMNSQAQHSLHLVHFCRYVRAIAYSISPIDLHDFQGMSIMKIRLRAWNQGPQVCDHASFSVVPSGFKPRGTRACLALWNYFDGIGTFYLAWEKYTINAILLYLSKYRNIVFPSIIMYSLDSFVTCHISVFTLGSTTIVLCLLGGYICGGSTTCSPQVSVHATHIAIVRGTPYM
jgi:hypothetical protein